MQEVWRELKLTEEQRQKLRPIFQMEMEKMRALSANTNLTAQQKLEGVRALREEVAPKVKEVLTPEQYEAWRKKVEETRGQLQKRLEQRKQN